MKRELFQAGFLLALTDFPSGFASPWAGYEPASPRAAWGWFLCVGMSWGMVVVPSMHTFHGCWPWGHSRAEVICCGIPGIPVLQSWLILPFPMWASLPWAAGLSPISEAFHAKPRARNAPACPGLFFCSFQKILTPSMDFQARRDHCDQRG